jgi:hypothetical protein|nr:MAG TPA: Fms-interacting protein/Thoc5 [Ackermannviridae sp.]
MARIEMEYDEYERLEKSVKVLQDNVYRLQNEINEKNNLIDSYKETLKDIKESTLIDRVLNWKDYLNDINELNN